MEEILHTAMYDTDQWVAMVGDILKTYPETGSLNCDVDPTQSFFHEVINDLKKLGRYHLMSIICMTYILTVYLLICLLLSNTY